MENSQVETATFVPHPNSLANIATMGQTNLLAAEERKQAFLSLLDEHWPNVGQLCKILGIPRTTVYRWKAEDKEFEQKWLDIQEGVIDRLEKHLLNSSQEKGMAGLTIPVLRAYRRHLYGDKIDVSGQINSIQVVTTLNVPRMSQDGKAIVRTTNMPDSDNNRLPPSQTEE